MRPWFHELGVSRGFSMWFIGLLGALLPLAVLLTAQAATMAVSNISCSTASSSGADCLAQSIGGGASSPIGLSPAQIRGAYNWPTNPAAGAGHTIAIVDARDNPMIERDLAVFDQQYGLPACTTANGCFTKVDANGGNNYPSYNGGWAFEIAIDVEWAHTIAPGAKILLVEAKSANTPDLLSAEDYAREHAQYVSNSWATHEFKGEANDDSHFMQPGVSFFAASGDAFIQFAYPTAYPSASPNVVSVGGTQLNFNTDGTLLSETGWSGGGGGCSNFETANPAQSTFAYYPQVGCNGSRAAPDIAADASSGSPVSVYDSNPCGNDCGPWYAAFGTSVATPLWAARAADAGIVVNAATIYSSTLTYRDVTGGGNGAPCLAHFNLCAGRGSWIGMQP
jgi:subtilase family serine protease